MRYHNGIGRLMFDSRYLLEPSIQNRKLWVRHSWGDCRNILHSKLMP